MTERLARLLLLSSALWLWVGCKQPTPASPPEATCDEMVDHILSLPRDERLKVASREVFLANCEREDDPELRRCIVAARTLAVAKQCEISTAVRELRRRDAI